METIDYGDRLRSIRRYRKWTQLMLAKLLGCDQTRISCLENGRFALHFSDVGLAAQALHFSLDAFGRSGPFDLGACLLPMPKEVETIKEASGPLV